MTKKDYELIANCVNIATGNKAEENIKELIAQRLTSALYLKNDRFNPVKFLQACGLKK